MGAKDHANTEDSRPATGVNHSLKSLIYRGIFPLMKVMVADQKKRIVIPGAKPGEVFSVRPQNDGGFLCIRLVEASTAKAPSQTEVLERFEQSALTPKPTFRTFA